MVGVILATVRLKPRTTQTWADGTPKSFSSYCAGRASRVLTHDRCFPIRRDLCVLSRSPKDFVIGPGGDLPPTRQLHGQGSLE